MSEQDREAAGARALVSPDRRRAVARLRRRVQAGDYEAPVADLVDRLLPVVLSSSWWLPSEEYGPPDGPRAGRRQ